MEKVIITEKGASLKSNKWKEGQEVLCHANIAKVFIERGFALKEGQAISEDVKVDEPKAKKSKPSKEEK